MKQVFTKIYHEKFIKYFHIKENSSEIEEYYYKKTIKHIKYIKWIPWLKMIWIWNSISMNCAKSSSDIDLYIVTSNNSMWFVRILITLIFEILWIRKTTKKHKWRFCLSFFSTINWMNFSSFKIENDIYLYFWIIYFKPILDYDNTYNLFLEKNSSWADFSEYKDIIDENKNGVIYKTPPLIPPLPGEGKNCRKNCSYSFLQKGGRLGLGSLNSLLKKIFLKKTIKHYNKIWKPYWVIINDDLLKFHNSDIRKKIKEELV